MRWQRWGGTQAWTALGRLAAMHYIALATDYDGTSAEHGVVDEDTMKVLEKLRPPRADRSLSLGGSWPAWRSSCPGSTDAH
jgi:hypothetical protein